MTPFKLINLWQTAEERKGKYWLCRSLGANASWSGAMRDWRLAKIERRFGLESTAAALKELADLA